MDNLDSTYRTRIDVFTAEWFTPLQYYRRGQLIANFRHKLQSDYACLSAELQAETRAVNAEIKRYTNSCYVFKQARLLMPRNESYQVPEIVSEAEAVLAGEQPAFVLTHSQWQAQYGTPRFPRTTA